MIVVLVCCPQGLEDELDEKESISPDDLMRLLTLNPEELEELERKSFGEKSYDNFMCRSRLEKLRHSEMTILRESEEPTVKDLIQFSTQLNNKHKLVMRTRSNNEYCHIVHY